MVMKSKSKSCQSQALELSDLREHDRDCECHGSDTLRAVTETSRVGFQAH